MLIQITWIMAGIATPFVVARVCARLKHLKELRLDDYLMILSLVCVSGERIPCPADQRLSLIRSLRSSLEASP